MKDNHFNTIYHGDCIKGMQEMPESVVDLIITDPPFAIEFGAMRQNYNRTSERVLNGYKEIRREDYATFTMTWMQAAYRILKDSGNMFVFSGWNNLKDLLIAADQVGFTTVNHIVWKYQFGVVCRRRFVTSHYHCLFLCKDDNKRNFYPTARFSDTEKTMNGGSARYRDMEDVWTIKREYWSGDKKTPTKLPRELIEKILSYTSQLNDFVFDPFLGSGQVAVVSKLNGRKYGGFEIAEEYFHFAEQRLNQDMYRIPAEDDNKQSNLLL